MNHFTIFWFSQKSINHWRTKRNQLSKINCIRIFNLRRDYIYIFIYLFQSYTSITSDHESRYWMLIKRRSVVKGVFKYNLQVILREAYDMQRRYNSICLISRKKIFFHTHTGKSWEKQNISEISIRIQDAIFWVTFLFFFSTQVWLEKMIYKI